ncbi:MAG: GHKL domain-containing protein [Legionellales bacterium]|nr:GHKL domain-containing protein [Legionellales bacterium]
MLKKTNYFACIVSFSLSLIAILLLMRIFHLENLDSISLFSAQAGLVFHIFMLILSFKLYNNANSKDRKILYWLVITNIGLFLNDLAFYFLIYNPNNYYIHLSFVSFIIDIIPYAIWLIALVIFLSKILTRELFNTFRFLKVLSSLTLINLIIITLFFVSVQSAFDFSSWQNISQILSSMIELVIFDFAILCLIYSENKGFSLILAGLTVLIAGDFLIASSYLTQGNFLQSYADLLWLLGLMLVLFGMIYIQQKKEYAISTWLRKMNVIKSKLASGAFNLSLLIILSISILIYFTSPLEKTLFLILPSFIMIYSVLIVVLSNIIAQRFEEPFKKIEHNIEALMSKNDKSLLDDNFSIEEFIFLQKFIVEAFEVKEEKDRAQREIGSIATQVAHDIRSPLAAILMLSKESSELPEELRLVLRDATHRIEDIANNLLHKTHKSDLHNQTEKTGLFLISAAILSVISEKKMQYKDVQLNINYLSQENAAFSCISANLTEFKRVISNLLNNAIEALTDLREITVKLFLEADNICIDIADTGTGMPEEITNKILNGEVISNKVTGLGLGFSHARSFLASAKGELKISSQGNKGTTVGLVFNKRPPPIWLAINLTIHPDSIIVIMDDDASIHGAWNNLLSATLKKSAEIQVVHFIKALDCIEYLKKLNPDMLNRVLMLADYELIKQNFNGLDVIALAQLNSATLVTSHYENNEIINRAILLNTKILPKMLVSEVAIDFLPRATSPMSNASIVILEDNKAFSDILTFLCQFRGKLVDIYHDPYTLFNALDQYDSSTIKLCLDFDLACPVNGIEVAKKLHEKGFKLIYLASGYDFKPGDVPDYITVLSDKMEMLNL